ncbi:MAG TPA: dihydrofolate reductase family protein [Bacillota bacterium]|nr:dihydrofolate reductase family protein [Bacillota bacterium]
MQQVVLYMAQSADGYIAGEHDETPWSDEEWAVFQEFVRSCDVCLVGRRTYEIMKAGGEFLDDARYVVVSSDPDYSADYPVVSIASSADVPAGAKIGVIGGGELNGCIARLGLIDEVILDIEPVILGAGLKLFGDKPVDLNLELTQTKRIGPSTLQLHYRVVG